MHERTPRNIRDIAHLYISRPGSTTPRRIVVSGATRECFPGLHAANLAAAFALEGHPVRLIEQSDLLANAAFFLALPARVYATARGRHESGSVTALGGVEVWFAPPPVGIGAASRYGRGCIDLVHAPPLDGESEFTNDEESDIVYVANSAADLGARPSTNARSWFLLTGAIEGSPPPAGVLSAGRVNRWERSLADPLPIVVRDPSSAVARCYRRCCELLAAHPPRRSHEAGHPGLRSRVPAPRGG